MREEAAPRSYEARPSNGTYCHNPRDIIIYSNVGNNSHNPVTEENGNSKQQRHPNHLSILVMHQFHVEVHESLIVLFILILDGHNYFPEGRYTIMF